MPVCGPLSYCASIRDLRIPLYKPPPNPRTTIPNVLLHFGIWRLNVDILLGWNPSHQGFDELQWDDGNVIDTTSHWDDEIHEYWTSVVYFIDHGVANSAHQACNRHAAPVLEM
jgi:hypothetical protein